MNSLIVALSFVVAVNAVEPLDGNCTLSAGFVMVRIGGVVSGVELDEDELATLDDELVVELEEDEDTAELEEEEEEEELMTLLEEDEALLSELDEDTEELEDPPATPPKCRASV